MTTESAIDLVAIGEVLVDFISTEVVDSLGEAATFQRHLGGSRPILPPTSPGWGGTRPL
jgi:hypothetical protein